MAFCFGSLMSLCLSQTNFEMTNPPSADIFVGTRTAARNATSRNDFRVFIIKIGGWCLEMPESDGFIGEILPHRESDKGFLPDCEQSNAKPGATRKICNKQATITVVSILRHLFLARWHSWPRLSRGKLDNRGDSGQKRIKIGKYQRFS